MNFKEFFKRNFIYIFFVILLIYIFFFSGSGKEKGSAGNLDLNVNYGFLLLKMVLVLAGVILLAVFVIRFILPKIYLGSEDENKGRIKVIERKMLGGGKTLLLVEVDGEKFLMGISGDNMFKLLDFSKKQKDFDAVLEEIKDGRQEK